MSMVLVILDDYGHFAAFRYDTDAEKRAAILAFIEYKLEDGRFGITDETRVRFDMPGYTVESARKALRGKHVDKELRDTLSYRLKSYEENTETARLNKKVYEILVAKVKDTGVSIDELVEDIEGSVDQFTQRGSCEIVQLQ